MKYQIVLSDPPWQQTKGNLRKCRPNQGKSLDYETTAGKAHPFKGGMKGGLAFFLKA